MRVTNWLSKDSSDELTLEASQGNLCLPKILGNKLHDISMTSFVDYIFLYLLIFQSNVIILCVSVSISHGNNYFVLCYAKFILFWLLHGDIYDYLK